MELINNGIETKIYELRGLKVMLDSDLAKLYEVDTSYLNRQVKRNFDRFNDEDFMFELSSEEFENLKCQNGTSSWGGKRKLPKVFTEQGVYMLATVINSNVAVEITKHIMRTFTKMREFALNYKDIVVELQKMKEDIRDNKLETSKNSDYIKQAFELLSQIIDDTKKTNENLIGFKPK